MSSTNDHNSAELPIVAHLDEIARLVSQHPIVLLSSPPGTGKTTLLPPYLLSARSPSQKRIALLEPRRIAAVRTAEFIGASDAALVGYRVRGESRVSSTTRIEVQTYGVFNRIAASSVDLADYDLVIFDEAHERSIDIDLALAQALEIQSSIRPDLKIVIMSATLNVEDLRRIAPSAPLVTITAVAHPVEISYLPATAAEERNLEAHVVRATRGVLHRPGDILIFLPGAAEITRATNALIESFPQRNVVALFGDLSLKEQRAVLHPDTEEQARIVVASSIAETSLTVARVHTVIDSGFSRVPRFDPERGLPGLDTVRVSSATAEQRTGRAGRLGPGICVRLWAAHEPLVRFRSPEIMESDLTPLLLTLASAGISDHRTLSWLTPPALGAVQAAKDLLEKLTALDGGGRITPHGTRMQMLPVHPRLAHLTLCACERGQAQLGCQLAAAWSELKPSKMGSIVDLNTLTSMALPSSAGELTNQLLGIVKRNQLETASAAGTKLSAALYFAAAFPDRIGHRRGDGAYLLSAGSRAQLPQGSSLAREEWLVCPAVRLRPGATTATISAASAISETELRTAFPRLFSRSTYQAFKADRRAVVTREIEMLSRIEISAHESPSASAEASTLLLQNLAFSDLPVAQRTTTVIERARWLHQAKLYSTPSGRWWELLSQPGLLWLAEFVPGASRLTDISEDALHHAVVRLAGGSTIVEAIARLAPSRITLPGGRSVTLHYTDRRAPVAASRLQDFFGTSTHPTIANGRVAVICELLSPAGRPVQVTDDLPRFWIGSYAQVRKELKSRYPKHDWPEKP